jgi:hypothetical protein
MRRIRWPVDVACMGEKENAYRVLVGRHRHVRERNIKMQLKEIGWKVSDGILVGAARRHWRGYMKYGSSVPNRVPISF